MKNSLLLISITMLLATTVRAEQVPLGTVLVTEDGKMACRSGACGNSSDGNFVAFKLPEASPQARALAKQAGKYAPLVFRHINDPLYLSPEDTLDLVQRSQWNQDVGHPAPPEAGNPILDALMQTRIARFTICTFFWEPKSDVSFVNLQCAEPLVGNLSFSAVTGFDNSYPGVGAWAGFTNQVELENLIPDMRIAAPDFWTGPKRNGEFIKRRVR